MHNIVIFGPAHSGKTTLAGYIYSHYMTEKQFNHEEKVIKENLERRNIEYEMSNRFNYFISLDEEEYERNKPTKSKQIHMKHIPHSNGKYKIDLTYIEIPALENKNQNQKYGGLFIGELGIFVIQIEELLKLSVLRIGSTEYKKRVTELFATLFFWCSIKKQKNTILVISKTENCYFADIRCAIDVIYNIKAFRNMTVLPIGLYISERKDYNIFDNDNCNSKIKQKFNPLMKEIICFVKNDKNNSKQNDIRFAYISDLQDNKNELVVKALSGEFVRGERVKIYPVRLNERDVKNEAFLKIKQIVSIDSDRQEYPMVESGKILGILANRVTFLDKRVSLEKLLLSKTSLLMGEETNYFEGNYLLFRIKTKTHNVFEEKYKTLKPRNTINLLWFGKILLLQMICRFKNDEFYFIGGFVVENGTVIMPLDKNNNENNLPYKFFTLEIDGSCYIDAELIQLKNINYSKEINYTFTMNGINRDVERALYESVEIHSGSLITRDNFYQMCNDLKSISLILEKYNTYDYELSILE